MNINNQQNITDVFSNYLLTTADNIINKNISNTTKNDTININNDTFMHFMLQAFTTKYPYVNSKLTITREVENIIKALKSKNSQGYNEISTEILKVISPFITSH